MVIVWRGILCGVMCGTDGTKRRTRRRFPMRVEMVPTEKDSVIAGGLVLGSGDEFAAARDRTLKDRELVPASGNSGGFEFPVGRECAVSGVATEFNFVDFRFLGIVLRSGAGLGGDAFGVEDPRERRHELVDFFHLFFLFLVLFLVFCFSGCSNAAVYNPKYEHALTGIINFCLVCECPIAGKFCMENSRGLYRVVLFPCKYAVISASGKTG
jgi:hypothetical protein